MPLSQRFSIEERALYSYLRERSKVSARHKLPTLDDIRGTNMWSLLGEDRLVKALKSLVERGYVIEQDGYYGTELKDVL